MACTELHQLQNLLAQNDVRPSPADLVSVVCGSCDSLEVCPAEPIREIDAQQSEPDLARQAKADHSNPDTADSE